MKYYFRLNAIELTTFLCGITINRIFEKEMYKYIKYRSLIKYSDHNNNGILLQFTSNLGLDNISDMVKYIVMNLIYGNKRSVKLL